MNNNFVSWEITQLLPENNPYSNLDEWVEIEDDNLDEVYYKLKSELTENECAITIRSAWTYDDVRLYLLSKGYYVDIMRFQNNPKYPKLLFNLDIIFNDKWTDKWWLNDNIRWFETYEEIREYGIKFCLNLIKNENN